MREKWWVFVHVLRWALLRVHQSPEPAAWTGRPSWPPGPAARSPRRPRGCRGTLGARDPPDDCARFLRPPPGPGRMRIQAGDRSRVRRCARHPPQQRPSVPTLDSARNKSEARLGRPGRRRRSARSSAQEMQLREPTPAAFVPNVKLTVWPRGSDRRVPGKQGPPQRRRGGPRRSAVEGRVGGGRPQSAE